VHGLDLNGQGVVAGLDAEFHSRRMEMKKKENKPLEQDNVDNRKNRKDSTEPGNATENGSIGKKKKVTPAVRKANRRNPLKDGLFAREFIFTEQEKIEFQGVRRVFRAQLQPTTALQEIGLDGIVSGWWRCKLALRREMRRLSLLDKNDQEVQPEGTISPNSPTKWYATGPKELNDATRWLGGIRNDFKENRVVRPEWKESMDLAFGSQLYESLTKWTPMNFQSILAIKNIEMHSKTYGSADLRIGAEKSSEVTIDPDQGYQMADKLIEQELRHLVDLRRGWEQRVSEFARIQSASSADFWRYYTAASRDLRHAVDWYLNLKKNAL
jgi:hypothetical protein